MLKWEESRRKWVGGGESLAIWENMHFRICKHPTGIEGKWRLEVWTGSYLPHTLLLLPTLEKAKAVAEKFLPDLLQLAFSDSIPSSIASGDEL